MSALFQILLTFLGKTAAEIFFHAAYKISITSLYISLVIAAIAGYVYAYKTIVNSLTATMPDVVVGVWGWVMPSNIHACFTSIIATLLLRFAYSQWLKIINHRFKASISN